MELKLDPEQIQGFVEQAILNAISEGSRDAIVTEAVRSLLTPKESLYGFRRQATPLQDAFDQAVHRAARTIVEEQLAADPVLQAKIRELVSAPIAEICQGNYDGLPERIGEGVGAAVTEWLQARR